MTSHWAALTVWGWNTAPGLEVVLPPTLTTKVSACEQWAKRRTERYSIRRFIRRIFPFGGEYLEYGEGLGSTSDAWHLNFILCLLLTNSSPFDWLRNGVHLTREERKMPCSFYHGCPIGFCEGGHGSGCDIILMGGIFSSFDFETHAKCRKYWGESSIVYNLQYKRMIYRRCLIKYIGGEAW